MNITSAFPVLSPLDRDGSMSLRDYFAAHCPMLSNDSLSWRQEAEARYAYADAMMAERSKQP